jgi:hypothetical protein
MLQVSQRCRQVNAGAGTLICADGVVAVGHKYCTLLNFDPYEEVIVSGVLESDSAGKFRIRDGKLILADISVKVDSPTMTSIKPLLKEHVDMAIQKLGIKPELEGLVVEKGVMQALPEGISVGNLRFTIPDACYMADMRKLLPLFTPEVVLVIRPSSTKN